MIYTEDVYTKHGRKYSYCFSSFFNVQHGSEDTGSGDIFPTVPIDTVGRGGIIDRFW